MSVNHRQTDRLLAAALPEGVIVLNCDGQLNWWNHVARELLCLSYQRHKSKSILELVRHPQLKELVLHHHSGGFEMESPYKPDMRLRFDLYPYWGAQLLLIVQDVTRTHRLEAMRQDFIANISHELRTPLTVFQGYLEILQDHDMIDADHRANIFNQMQDQTDRMSRLIEDLLLLSKLESNTPNKEEYLDIDVASLVQDICHDARQLSGDQQHEFYLSLDKQLKLKADKFEIRSAFSNLVYNAVRYTPAGGKIEIYWYQDQHGKHFKVKDSGIGIAKKYIPRITQRFYRVDKSRTYKGKGGTGLGLAIVKHVLLRHNAKLHISSEMGKGSCFCCTFKPLHQADPVAIPA